MTKYSFCFEFKNTKVNFPSSLLQEMKMYVCKKNKHFLDIILHILRKLPSKLRAMQ